MGLELGSWSIGKTFYNNSRLRKIIEKYDFLEEDAIAINRARSELMTARKSLFSSADRRKEKADQALNVLRIIAVKYEISEEDIKIIVKYLSNQA